MSYPSGATDVPPPSGCGSCECRDGALSCSEEACTTGVPITPCGQSIASDPFALTRTLLVGDRLTVEMQHPGGCTRHDYALCYSDIQSAQNDLIEAPLIHDGHGDGCEAQLVADLSFDLSPLADAYVQIRNAASGVVDTGYGLYAFGTLTCEERTTVAELQSADAASKVATSCEFASDWVVAATATSCSAGCPVAVSTTGEAELEALPASVEGAVCGDAAADCEAPTEACPSLDVDCVGGRCTAVP